MAVNFPNNPQVGETYTLGNRTWQWSGEFWRSISTTIGYTGSRGVDGFTGSQGISGEPGEFGFTGSQGLQGPIGYTGSAGTGGSGTSSLVALSATAFFPGQLTIGDTNVPRWYPNRPISVAKSVARVIIPGASPVLVNIRKNGTIVYGISVTGTGPEIIETVIAMEENDYLTIEITGTGVGAEDVYLTFIYYDESGESNV